MINLLMRKSKEKLNSSKTSSLKLKLLMLRRKDNQRKFFLRKEPPNSKNFKRKKPSKNSRLKRKSKNSLLLKLFKRLKPPLPRKPPLKLTLPE